MKSGRTPGARASGQARARRQARSIFDAALAAADPGRAVERSLAKRDFSRFRHIYVVGAGKAGVSMARAAERILGKRISAGLVAVKEAPQKPLRRIELRECGHPVPDARGVETARRIAEIAERAQAGDLVLCLISGGASALMPLPAPPVTLQQKQEITRLLLACGATIHEINTVRKHLSLIKGGQLARLAAPAAVESLLVSDVVGDNLDVIGSGPTSPDSSSFAQAGTILEKYRIWRRTPMAVRKRLGAGMSGRIPDNPRPRDPIFAHVRNTILASNRTALDAAARRARALGFRTLILASGIEGETREIARMHAAIARECATAGRPVKPPACFISGGETTVTIRGKGLGGRNQEFVLAAAIDIAGLSNVVVFSAGTDGTDGPTKAAGAVADGTTTRKPDARGYLDNNDSYHYFQRLGDLVITGPTNTNVMDVRIMLVF